MNSKEQFKIIPKISELYAKEYLSDLDFYFAQTMARLAREDDPLVLLGAALASRFTCLGHVCVDLKYIAKKRVQTPEGEELEDFFWPDERAWVSALKKSALVVSSQDNEPSCPLVLDSKSRLYLARYWLYQKRLGAELKKRAILLDHNVDENLLADGVRRLFPVQATRAKNNSSYDQRLAAVVAVLRKFALICGGPGTGKTSTVVRILVLLMEQALVHGKTIRIVLAAPTGKAATRLTKAIQNAKNATGEDALQCNDDIKHAIPENATTIHRTLGVQTKKPSQFRHNAANPLDADVVVVDEASMIDVALMTKLIEAVPKNAHLIVLGDKDQLASVEAGAVLGDIWNTAIEYKNTGAFIEHIAKLAHIHVPHIDHRIEESDIRDCITELSTSFRFSSQSGIGRLASAINKGDVQGVLYCLEHECLPDVEFIELASAEKVNKVIGPIIHKYYQPYINAQGVQERLSRLDSFRILCAHRRGPTGCENMNVLVQNIAGKKHNTQYYDGEPVIITRNDYELGLFNGDVGIICFDEESHALRAFFPGKSNSFAPSRLSACELVYAMTIHKSQGSEFEHVLIVLPDKHSALLTRELLYTAVTRARKNVILYATKDAIRKAVSTPIHRASGLHDEFLCKF